VQVATTNPRTAAFPVIGRCFMNPLVDYLLIGGGLSLIVTAVVFARGTQMLLPLTWLPWFILLSNSAHFAASTVRLYTKPGARQALPFLAGVFPLAVMGLATLSIWRADQVGHWIQTLYLNWSPYHYAAQAYGLAVMYGMRSGCALELRQKRWLWWVAVLPFVRELLHFAYYDGLPLVVPYEARLALTGLDAAVPWLLTTLGALSLLLPVVWYAGVSRRIGRPLPAIMLTLILANGIWWVLLPVHNAFFWATIFHGIQYMAIVTIFHAHEQLSRPDNRHGAGFHVAKFYALSLALAYALFHCWPQAYRWLGFGSAESLLMCVAVINIHHFVVDAYVWRLQKGDSNRRIVEEALRESPAAVPVAGVSAT
jgi:hypothetical protein